LPGKIDKRHDTGKAKFANGVVGENYSSNYFDSDCAIVYKVSKQQVARMEVSYFFFS
jgi:hypothetical protein